MADGDLRLAAKLARQAGKIHPRDWVDVYESHTPYEWSLQRLLARVDPWGDDRADLRMGFGTARLFFKDVPDGVSDVDLEATAREFAGYLQCDAPPVDDEEADLQALDRMQQEA